MGLEGIGEPIEQGIALPDVMGLVFAQLGEATARPQLVEPAAPPWALLEHPMKVGAGHHAALLPLTWWQQAGIGAGEGADLRRFVSHYSPSLSIHGAAMRNREMRLSTFH